MDPVYVSGMKAILRFADGKPIELDASTKVDIPATIQLYYGSEPVEDPVVVPFQWNTKLEVTLTPSEPITVDGSTIEVPVLGTRRQSFKPIHIKPSDSLTLCWTLTLGN